MNLHLRAEHVRELKTHLVRAYPKKNYNILIEHETIDKEQFERLLRGEPEQTVLAPETAPEQANPKPPRKPARKPRPSGAQPAKPVLGAAAARAVRREDAIDAASTRPPELYPLPSSAVSRSAPSSGVGVAGGKETT